jgi:hypothetical protein
VGFSLNADEYVAVVPEFVRRGYKRRLKIAVVGGAIENRGTLINSPRGRSFVITESGRAKECIETWSSGRISADVF